MRYKNSSCTAEVLISSRVFIGKGTNNGKTEQKTNLYKCKEIPRKYRRNYRSFLIQRSGGKENVKGKVSRVNVTTTRFRVPIFDKLNTRHHKVQINLRNI